MLFWCVRACVLTPEQRKMFPGLIFRPEASPVVLLCFYSGTVLAVLARPHAST